MPMREIRSQLEQASRAAELRTFRQTFGVFGDVERRTFSHTSISSSRAGTVDSGATDGALRVIGHAAVFDKPSVEMASVFGTFTERIAPTAFDEVLARNNDVLLTWDHDTRYILGRTSNKTLDLTIDAVGLHYWSRVAPTSYAADLKILMDEGYLNQSSFLFRIAPGGEEWLIREDEEGNEIVERTITVVGELYDVCVCAAGAYPDTDSGVARTAAYDYAVASGYLEPRKVRGRRATDDEVRAIGDVAWGPEEGVSDLMCDLEDDLNFCFSIVDVSLDLSKAIVCDWDDFTFWVAPLSQGDDGEPMLGNPIEWVQVGSAWVTTAEGYEANIRSSKSRREARMSDTETVTTTDEVVAELPEAEVAAAEIEETPAAEAEAEAAEEAAEEEATPEAEAEVDETRTEDDAAKARLLAAARARISHAKIV